MNKKNISIFSMGGTIAGSSSSSVSAAYSSGKIELDKLLSHLPLEKIAKIKSYQLANIGSQEMDEKHLLLLAKTVQKEVDKKDVDGVLILHGTDTLEESAYFLHLCIKTKKPVVFTGAMRSNSSLSNDGDLNIFNALKVASSKKSRKHGVLVVLNDQIHSAREVCKQNTSSLQTFASPNSGALGFVHYGKVEFLLKSLKKHSYKSKLDAKPLPRVDIIYAHLNDTDIFVHSALKAGAKGIVVAGFGNGNIHPLTLKALQDASKKGVVVLRSSRVGSGKVSENGEIDDKKLGFLSARDLNPQKARILLQLALNKTQKLDNLQNILAHY